MVDHRNSAPLRRGIRPIDVPLPAIDVVVLSWNDGPLLDEALHSVRASLGVAPRVIVVDNASDPQVLLSDPAELLLRNDCNRGVAAGRNQGIAAGSSPYICILDSDARLEPDALAHLIGVMATDDVGVSVPVFVDQLPEQSAGQAPTIWRKAARATNRTDRYRTTKGDRTTASWEVDFGIGACQVFRRSVWEAVGGIDESFFYGPEDVDFCLRAKDAGWRVVQVRAARVHHPPRRRFRTMTTRRGLSHAWCIGRYAVRHRSRLTLSGRIFSWFAASPPRPG